MSLTTLLLAAAAVVCLMGGALTAFASAVVARGWRRPACLAVSVAFWAGLTLCLFTLIGA